MPDTQKNLKNLINTFDERVADHDARIKALEEQLNKAKDNLNSARSEYDSAKASLQADEMILAKNKISNCEEVVAMFKSALCNAKEEPVFTTDVEKIKEALKKCTTELNADAEEKVVKALKEAKAVINQLDQDLTECQKIGASVGLTVGNPGAFCNSSRTDLLDDVAFSFRRLESKGNRF